MHSLFDTFISIDTRIFYNNQQNIINLMAKVAIQINIIIPSNKKLTFLIQCKTPCPVKKVIEHVFQAMFNNSEWAKNLSFYKQQNMTSVLDAGYQAEDGGRFYVKLEQDKYEELKRYSQVNKVQRKGQYSSTKQKQQIKKIGQTKSQTQTPSKPQQSTTKTNKIKIQPQQSPTQSQIQTLPQSQQKLSLKQENQLTVLNNPQQIPNTTLIQKESANNNINNNTNSNGNELPITQKNSPQVNSDTCCQLI